MTAGFPLRFLDIFFIYRGGRVRRGSVGLSATVRESDRERQELYVNVREERERERERKVRESDERKNSEREPREKEE